MKVIKYSSSTSNLPQQVTPSNSADLFAIYDTVEGRYEQVSLADYKVDIVFPKRVVGATLIEGTTNSYSYDLRAEDMGNTLVPPGLLSSYDTLTINLLPNVFKTGATCYLWNNTTSDVTINAAAGSTLSRVTATPTVEPNTFWQLIFCEPNLFVLLRIDYDPSNLAALESQLDTVASNIETNLQTQLDAVQADVNMAQSDITDLQTSVTTLSTDLASTQASITTLRTTAGSVYVGNPTNTTVIKIPAAVGYTINSIKGVAVDVGSCTLAVKINGVAVGGLEAVAVTTTPQNVTATGANIVADGDLLTYEYSKVISAEGFRASISIYLSL